MCSVMINPPFCDASQAKHNFEGFLAAHMTDEEKVIVHVETSLSV